MLRLSSNITLILKIFLPTFWTTIFGLFLVVLFVAEEDHLGVFAFPAYKYGYVAFFVLFITFLYFTVIKLLRVEANHEDLYVSNYLKTYRIPIQNIAKVTETNMLLFTLVTFHLRQRGSFGKKIHFVAKKSNYTAFIRDQQAYLSSLG